MNGEFPYQPLYPMGGTDGEPEPREVPDMSNAHFSGDRPACEAPEQKFPCPKCGKEMEFVETVSMGAGYTEFEDLASVLRCQCGHEEELQFVKEIVDA